MLINTQKSILIILASLYEINAYRYLVVSPVPSKSHAILGNALVEHLVNAGHEVSYITSCVPDKMSPRVTIIDTSANTRLYPEDRAINITEIMYNKGKLNFLYVDSLMLHISRATISNPNVQKFIADKTQKFDAVISEWMFNEVYAGFAGVFNCPLIWFSSVETHWMIIRLVDEIPNPAYTSSLIFDRVPPLNFKERVIELGIQIISTLFKTLWTARIERSMYDEYFVPFIQNRYRSVPPFETLRYNASLVLSNSHLSISHLATKLPPNVISIGGYHIERDLKDLPKDLQQIMDNASHGVIYFSMGSNMRSQSLPDIIKQELLNMFGKLKQTIIWKFEDKLRNSPSNVHIVKWAPQQSILAHKNCVLFITHGGLLSTTETVHYGVPIIGIPAFGDQYANVARAVEKGFALKVDLSFTITSDLEIAIGKILDDSKYAARVKELSEIYHDRSVPPAKELIHWVEHVVKTKGAPHLRSLAFMVPWYQKLYIDLILVIVVIVLILKYFFIFIKCSSLIKIKEKVN